MSAISDFHLKIRGPAADLEELKAAVLKDTEPMPEDSPFREQFILYLRTETWGDMGDSDQEFLWLNGVAYYRCEVALGQPRPGQDELLLDGQAKYHAPTAFVRRAMEMFPALEFDLHATTEHEDYEHWHSAPDDLPRRLVCCEERVTDLSRDTVVYLRIADQEILNDLGRSVDAIVGPRGRSAEAREGNWQEEGF